MPSPSINGARRVNATNAGTMLTTTAVSRAREPGPPLRQAISGASARVATARAGPNVSVKAWVSGAAIPASRAARPHAATA